MSEMHAWSYGGGGYLQAGDISKNVLLRSLRRQHLVFQNSMRSIVLIYFLFHELCSTQYEDEDQTIRNKDPAA